jgi:hypothetical protein
LPPGIYRRVRAARQPGDQGGRVIAFDTAAPATKLINLYKRWGYQEVGNVDWRPFTNYLSVVLMRPVPAMAEEIV